MDQELLARNAKSPIPVTGFLAADSGTVSFDGRDLTAVPATGRARAGMVLTFAAPREVTHLTVRENLMAAVPGQAGAGLPAVFFRPGACASKQRVFAARARAPAPVSRR